MSNRTKEIELKMNKEGQIKKTYQIKKHQTDSYVFHNNLDTRNKGKGRVKEVLKV